MVAIQGLGGIPEPKPEQPAKVRKERDSASTTASSASSGAQSKDGVLISSEAKAAAAVAQIIQSTGTQGDIRTDKVEAARQRLERGDYKNPEVVAQVAQRLLKYLG